MGGMNWKHPNTINHAKTSVCTETFAGAIISVVKYLALLRYCTGEGFHIYSSVPSCAFATIKRFSRYTKTCRLFLVSRLQKSVFLKTYFLEDTNCALESAKSLHSGASQQRRRMMSMNGHPVIAACVFFIFLNS
jgi:hypothetical protein